MPVDRAQLNAVGDIVLTSPQALEALADPLRLAVFEFVRRNGPVSSETIAERLGRDHATALSHLHELAANDLIDVQHDEVGAELWSTPARGIYFEIPESFEGQAAARRLSSLMLAEASELPARWTREIEPQLIVEWARAAGVFSARIELTSDELRDLQEQLERLLEPFTNRSADDVPAGAGPVRVLTFFLPEPNLD